MGLFYSGPFVIAVGDVVLSDITNNAKNQATFTMYVYIKDRTDALDRKILAVRSLSQTACTCTCMYMFIICVNLGHLGVWGV